MTTNCHIRRYVGRMKLVLLPALMASIATLAPIPAVAQNGVGMAGDVVTVDLLEGWREADGRHMAAIRLTLADGWKTYWRAPGDGGLPTTLQWSNSDNLDALRILWPRPDVFEDGRMRSLGYTGEVVLPIELTPNKDGDITLDARLNFGVCKEVCVPAAVDLQHVMTDHQTGGVTQIRAALGTAPTSASQADIHSITCAIEPTAKGHALSVDVSAHIAGKHRAMVVEITDPEVWVSATNLKTDGPLWQGMTHIYDHRAVPSTIDLSEVRITLLTDNAAIDIQGCDLP